MAFTDWSRKSLGADPYGKGGKNTEPMEVDDVASNAALFVLAFLQPDSALEESSISYSK